MESSSFPGLIYSGKRGTPFPSVFDWLAAKRRDDDVGNLWRVHDKLYDLVPFIPKHPGGSDWIRFTQGTDITEAFEASHIVRFDKVEKILAKYYVSDITKPRNSPYTFKPSGFYKTLKKRAEPILREVGTNPSPQALRIQDGLAVAYMTLAVISVWTSSIPLQILAGILLGMTTVGAHNYFHKKDTWRMYYMDLSPLSSFEWRLSHALSHHFYPNTILDFEVIMAEPLLEYLPSRPKSFVQKYVAMFYIDALYFVFMWSQGLVRFKGIWMGKQELRPENLLIFFELLAFLYVSPSYKAGFLAWVLMFTIASFWLLIVGAQHHHPDAFHDGDEPRPDPDFGLCQLDATKGKTDWFHKPLLSVLTTFGEHPIHHLFPTVCHSKLEYLKPVLEETLQEFSERFPRMSQLQLFIGQHRQLKRTTRNPFRKS